jgi:RimJ/RimL family protein N-acetyltransferase
LIRIRRAVPADAAALHELKRALDDETHFMMLEPGERTPDIGPEQREIERDAVFVAEAGGELVGYVQAERGGFRRVHHLATIFIGVRAHAWGQGIGGRLFAAVHAWAAEQGITRLQLDVDAANTRAIALYERLGYRIEGTKRQSMLVNGAFVDDHIMARLTA